MDIPLDIEMNRSNLTYLLNAWLRLYLQEDDNNELEIRSKKIIRTLSITVDGVKILPKSIIDDLDKSFSAYQEAKIDYENELSEMGEFVSDDDFKDVMSRYIQGIKGAYYTAIKNLRLP